MNKIQPIFIKLQYNPNNRKQADNIWIKVKDTCFSASGD